MARPLRIEYPGAYYHVMNRGNRGEDIFLTDEDRRVFLDALADSCEIYRIKLITFVLMRNHFHLLVQIALNQLDVRHIRRHLVGGGIHGDPSSQIGLCPGMIEKFVTCVNKPDTDPRGDPRRPQEGGQQRCVFIAVPDPGSEDFQGTGYGNHYKHYHSHDANQQAGRGK